MSVRLLLVVGFDFNADAVSHAQADEDVYIDNDDDDFHMEVFLCFVS